MTPLVGGWKKHVVMMGVHSFYGFAQGWSDKHELSFTHGTTTRDNAVILVGSDTDYHDDDADLFCGRKNWTQSTSLGPTAASSGDGVKCRNLPAQSPMSSRAKQAAAADMASKTWSNLSLLRTKHFTLLPKNLGKITQHCHHTITTFPPLSVTYKKYPLPPGAPRFHPRNKQSWSCLRDYEAFSWSRELERE